MGFKVETNTEKANVKPFLRWAGGKRWLVKHLDNILGNLDYQSYHEPFLGSGAIFFALNPSKKIFLSDLNQELIDTYNALKENPKDIIEKLKGYKNTKDFYYHMRSTIYSDAVSRASRFIYLNQTSYNGIYRVNEKGIYNVPYGYRKKNFLEEETLRNASKRLENANVIYGDFDCIVPNLGEKDLVFLDPPYTVSHNDNGFIKYNQKLFSLDDQKRLRKLIDVIHDKKAYYLLTNAAHMTIQEIFERGDRQIELNRASLIGGENAKRGSIMEYVFTNIPKQED